MSAWRHGLHSWRWPLALGGALAAALALSLVQVGENEQAVVLRLGDPVRVINGWQPGSAPGTGTAGLAWRLPLLDRVVRVDRRVLWLAVNQQQVLSADQQRLEVDAYARYRIVDPVRMLRTAGTAARLDEQLAPILATLLRQGLATEGFAALLAAGDGPLPDRLRAALDREARGYGVQVIALGIKGARLPDGAPLDDALARMQTSHEEEATAIRAEGEKNAQMIGADAQAQAARIYAASFGKDPQFYDFYRAMKSYETTLAAPPTGSAEAGQQQGTTTFVLTPDTDYLRQFTGAAGAARGR
ncbi:MAG TPA: SPFH domain-containing protein [Novosphingobium sp.]|nr:SPFH domain-containing protein [Novosphingobium sp.]HZV08868.1 SPFH domain-containing protein [Novosphingobium sp.]